MPLRKVHELTFLWFGLPGPLLIFLSLTGSGLDAQKQTSWPLPSDILPLNLRGERTQKKRPTETFSGRFLGGQKGGPKRVFFRTQKVEFTVFSCPYQSWSWNSPGACAMRTKFLDNKIRTFKILLSWRFPRKTAFCTIFLSALEAPPPLKKRKLFFIVVLPLWHSQQYRGYF